MSMASSFWKEDKYRTHFYCALCGGPFARVEIGARPDNDHETPTGDQKARQLDSIAYRQKLTNKEIDTNFLNNNPFELELQQTSSRRASTPEVYTAYDSAKLDSESLKWTRVIRALIHESARHQPAQGLAQLRAHDVAYLTGRGKVREDGSWADAYPSLESEPDSDEEDEFGLPHFGDDCGFHLYQEPDREDRQLLIGSIPFHDECWNILDHAYQVTRARKGLDHVIDVEIDEEDQDIDVNLLWRCLSENLSVCSAGNISDLTIASLRKGSAHDVVSRLSSRMLEESEWLVANPSSTKVLHTPFQPPLEGIARSTSAPESSTSSHSGTHPRDPFFALSHDLILETTKYLTMQEVFRWRIASSMVNSLPIPQRDYRRFLLEDMEYLPKLIQEARPSLESKEDQTDWKCLFEDLHYAHRSDPSLRNRRRIWKIVRPIAEEVLERSKENISHLNGDAKISNRYDINIVRGKVGVCSGAEGSLHSVFFSIPLHNMQPKATEGSCSPRALGSTKPDNPLDPSFLAPEDTVGCIIRIFIWLDYISGSLRGFEFNFEYNSSGQSLTIVSKKIFGRRTSRREEFVVPTTASYRLTGILAYWTGGCVSGIAFTLGVEGTPPDEFNIGELRSPCYGIWHGGGMRRLVAPPKYRSLAGVTGFVNNAGCIETLAIFEQTNRVILNGRGDPIRALSTVSLTQNEASLWHEETPRDVEFLNREGPTVHDWRTRKAEWAMIASTNNFKCQGNFTDLTVFCRGDLLVGLKFNYESTTDGKFWRRSQTLGHTDGNSSSMTIPADESVQTVVIGHTDWGIHSLQIVLSSGTVGPMLGKPYLAACHTVYTMADAASTRGERSGICHFLRTPIVGLHCLYIPELNRIGQLGVAILHPRADPKLASILDLSEGDLKTRPPSPFGPLDLPLLHTDEFQLPWVNTPPHRHLRRASKRSETSARIGKALESTFSGWVSFEQHIQSVTVFGAMQGIQFTYRSSKADDQFGDTSNALPTQTQRFMHYGERIIGIASIPPREYYTRRGSELPMLKFFINNKRTSKNWEIEIETDQLRGIKFSFTSGKICDWYPLIERGPSSKTDLPLLVCGQSENLSGIRVDADTNGWYQAFTGLFGTPSEDNLVNGVRGYQTGGQFSGLRLMRNGNWDEKAIGTATAFSTDFFLGPEEYFCAILSSNDAICFETTGGRISPWIGKSKSDKLGRSQVPHGQRPCGIYVAHSNPTVLCGVGFLLNQNKSHEVSTEPSTRQVGLEAAPRKRDLPSLRDYKWATDINLLDFAFAPAARFRDLAVGQTILPQPKLAHIIIFPKSLRKIEAYVNNKPSHYGLKALKFHGDPQMSTVVLGDWQDQFAEPSSNEMMTIDGCGGERIVTLKIGIHRHPLGDRIVKLLVRTNKSRETEIVSWRYSTREEPPVSMYQEYQLQADIANDYEISGFYYCLGLHIHDIQLITRRSNSTYPLSPSD
ncbi:MAG: hypothetical protein M1814_002818 [Vezdaea aestivalis]|nr:MAG: hypothetical protein M1814_002818 [Vezdaea aestivalis]